MPFSGLVPSKLNFFLTKIKSRLCVYEESFDTIFNMGHGSGKSPMDERVKEYLIQNDQG